jgi:peptidyl-prolyl cis-trans isomerase B (cyclophilin B)
MAARAERSRRRRRTQAAIGAGVAALVVVAGVTWLVAAGGGSSTKKSAGGQPSASPSPTTCGYYPLVAPGAASPSVTPSLPPEIKEVGTPPTTEPRSGTQVMTITTNLGVIKVDVDTAKAPCAANSFTYLAGKKFYDNTKCSRMGVSSIKVLQCGDPSATGRGGTSYRYNEENLPTGRRPAYPEGVVAVYNTGNPGTSGSQFFIVFGDSELPPNFTILGKVTSGLDIVKKVAEAGVNPAPDSQDPGVGAPKTEVKIMSLTMSAPNGA